MGTYVFSRIRFTAANEGGKREEFSAVLHTSTDGLKLELVEIRNESSKQTVFEAGTKGVKAEMISARAEPWLDSEGKECTVVYLEWKNVGTEPIHEIKAEIRCKDSKGRIIDIVSVPSFCAFASSGGDGILPGSTYRKPKGEGWVLGEVSYLKRLGLRNVEAKILQAYGKRGLEE